MSIEELNNLWERFGDIAINLSDKLDEPFLHFHVNTAREDVWHWFEAQNSEFVVAHQLYN